MPDAPPSRLALALTEGVALDALVGEALAARAIDRAAPLAADPGSAHEVHWGGRMQRAVLRVQPDDHDPDRRLLVVATLVAGEGWRRGLAHQARLVGALADVLGAGSRGVRDLSARTARDDDWLAAAAEGTSAPADVVGLVSEGDRLRWIATHGAARFGVPDLELYGVPADRQQRGEAAILAVLGRLLDGGLGADIATPDGRPLRLVPVLEVWPRLDPTWPGVGRIGRVRGPGLDGPRATLSVVRRTRFGRLPLDLAGVTDGA